MELKSIRWKNKRWNSKWRPILRSESFGKKGTTMNREISYTLFFSIFARLSTCTFLVVLFVSCTPSKKTNHAGRSGKNKETGGSEAQIADSNSEPKPESPDTESTPPSCPSSGEVSMSPINWSDSAGKLRWWHNERVLEEVKSSKEKPVEVCGVKGQLKWLMKAYCPDGKHPFNSLREAHKSRVGSIGEGGRCGKIVDLYRVPCETKVYEVYMSLYHCTESEKSPGGDSPSNRP